MWKSKKRSGKRSRTTIPNSSARTPLPRWGPSGRSHTGGSPSATCTWSSENGMKRTSQSWPARSPSTTASWALRANGQR